MSRGREPADRVVSPLARRGDDRWVRWCCALWLGLAGCSNRGEGASSGAQRPPGTGQGLVSPWKDGIGRVGNQVRGIEAMPDYDTEARQLRTRVERDLPDPLPSPRAACVSMLDGARQYYVDTEGEGSAAVKTMEATRDADLTACQGQTSPAAAACVAVLMSRSEGEFPWV